MYVSLANVQVYVNCACSLYIADVIIDSFKVDILIIWAADQQNNHLLNSRASCIDHLMLGKFKCDVASLNIGQPENI